jgi:hypothetical protein
LRTGSASSGGGSADAIPVARGPANAAPGREHRLVTDDVTKAAAVPVERQQAQVMTIDGLPRYNLPLLLLALLLAMVFAVVLGYEIRRDLRGSPSTAALRRRVPARALRAGTTVHAFSGSVRCSIAAWSAGFSARISPLRGSSRRTIRSVRTGLHGPALLLARRWGAQSSEWRSGMRRAQRLRTTVTDRLRPLVAGRLRRRRW